MHGGGGGGEGRDAGGSWRREIRAPTARLADYKERSAKCHSIAFPAFRRDV